MNKYNIIYFDLDSKPVQEDIIQQLCENQNIPDDVARDIDTESLTTDTESYDTDSDDVEW